ncbi:MAG: iron uptake porin, partial [Chroococcidiopsidaceae cyanobacterium CP_BM_RX_35]|nr:iron uptake porin [Chroococcidiopsidaceae cyanobacterium CP_BM_RX_35]
EGDLRFAGETFGRDNNNSVGIDALLYDFPLGKKTRVVLEANNAEAEDFTNTVNPYSDTEGSSGALSNFGTHNPIYDLASGAGIGLIHKFSDNLELSLGYLASAGNNPTGGNGLFNGPLAALGQLTIKPSHYFTLGLTYVNSYNVDLTAGSNRANLRAALLSDSGALPTVVGGGNSGNPSGNPGAVPSGNAELPTSVLAALRGQSLPTSSNSYGAEAFWQLSSKFALGGWVGFTKTRTLSTLGGTLSRGDLDIFNYAVTLEFPDLGKEGGLGGIIFGMEPKVTNVTPALKAQIGKDPNTSLHIEGFYQYPLTDNIAITPGVIWITAPNFDRRNADNVIGVIRATFVFGSED